MNRDVSAAEEGTVDLEEAATLLGVSRPFVRNLVRKGLLPCGRAGDDTRVPLEAVLTYRADREAQGRAVLENLFRETEELGR